MKIFNYTQYQYNKNNTPRRHAEIGSASDQSAKLYPTIGLSGKSSQTIQMGKTLKQVQGDSSCGAYVQGDKLCFHPNINYRISFGALKKNQFDGIDLAVVEKFKAPIEKFNSNQDLQNWAKVHAESIANTDFGGRQKETVIQRKAILKEWSDYVLKENDAYNSATALLILSAITKGLKADNNKFPPVLNKGVLADCISEIDRNTKADKKYQFNLNKMYETKHRAVYLEDAKVESGNTGWVIIPSKSNDPENFEQNVEKLKTLSHKNWCTKSYNAEPYLSEGDFHVYLENGEPKLGVRFVGDEIEEIQGERNNSMIPILYLDEVQKHIAEKELKLTSRTQYEIKSAKETKAKIEKIKTDLKETIENNEAKQIFEYIGIDTYEDKDEFLTISEYRQPDEDYVFSDIGIDENKLIQKVKKIEGSADFRDSKVTYLGKLESICGNAYFQGSQVRNLGNLKSIGRNAYFNRSQITNLQNLETIGGNANFFDCQIISLGNLESISGDTFFNNLQLTDLGNLKTIGGFANFYGSKILSLGNLEVIGGYADFDGSEVEDYGKLKYVNGKPFSIRENIFSKIKRLFKIT